MDEVSAGDRVEIRQIVGSDELLLFLGFVTSWPHCIPKHREHVYLVSPLLLESLRLTVLKRCDVGFKRGVHFRELLQRERPPRDRDQLCAFLCARAHSFVVRRTERVVRRALLD